MHRVFSEKIFINIDMGFCVVYNYKQQGKEFYGKKVASSPKYTLSIPERMGEQIRHARIQRNLSAETVSEKAEISRATL